MEPKMFFTSLHQIAGILSHLYLFTQVSEKHCCGIQQGPTEAGNITWPNKDEASGPRLAY